MAEEAADQRRELTMQLKAELETLLSSMSTPMLVIRPNVCATRNWVMVGEMPVERPAQLITVALPVLYLDKGGRLKARIHGRPRSDRKRRFLLSAVAPSTTTGHPRKARPINWAQRGGLASGRGNVS